MFASRANLGSICSKEGKGLEIWENLGDSSFRQQAFIQYQSVQVSVWVPQGTVRHVFPRSCPGFLTITGYLFPALVLKLDHTWEWSREHVKAPFPGPFLQPFMCSRWERAYDFAFLTSSQVKPKLLVWGSHFENHCPGAVKLIPEIPSTSKPEIYITLNIISKP